MRGLVALLALLARCRSLAPRFEVRGRSRAFTVAPLRSSTVGSGFEGKAEAGTFIDIPWDEIDLPKYEVHPRDREILRKAYEELPEGDVVPDIDPTSVDDLSPDEVLSEIERHKAMLALPDREEDVSHAIKCEVTGEMVEWFDDEVVEEKLEYWEVDEKEDPRFQVRSRGGVAVRSRAVTPARCLSARRARRSIVGTKTSRKTSTTGILRIMLEAPRGAKFATATTGLCLMRSCG
jgi:hypothetical protein